MEKIKNILLVVSMFFSLNVFAIDDSQVLKKQRLANEAIMDFADSVKGKGLKLSGVGGSWRC
ncbi:MAG: hypothetical protein P0S95_05970 [Rhabdochlamydiaceae bacterium]|nr:hypothetical protein [Candidatus Amphrikana amoebophyrae]